MARRPTMCGWDSLVEKISALPTTKQSVIALVYGIAEKLEDFDVDEERDDAAMVVDCIADLIYALRAKAEALADAVVHARPPSVIVLGQDHPQESDDDYAPI